MVRDMWETRDRPLLEAVALAEEGGSRVERVSSLNGTAGLSEHEVETGLRALYRDGLIDGAEASGMDDFELLDIELTGDGRRAIGQWPSGDAYADFVSLLEARIATAGEADRGRLEGLLASARSLGESTLGSLLAAFISRQASL